MVDILVLLLITGFFAIAVVFVHACERIIGPDLEADVRGDRTDRRGAARGMTGIESVVGLVLSALVTAYLVYALIFPEKL